MIEIQVPTRVSDILKTTVEDRHGDKIGTIEDLILGRNGSVKYAVLSQGGILGLGDRLIPIPFDALMPSTLKGIAVLDIDKQILEKAPDLESGDWSNFSESEWEAKVDRYFEVHVAMLRRGIEAEDQVPRISH